jgi:predicted acetyltransferase
MEKLKLIKPTMDLEEQVFEMVQEFYEDGSTPY